MDTAYNTYFPSPVNHYVDSYQFSDQEAPNYYPALGLMNTRSGGFRSAQAGSPGDTTCADVYTYSLMFEKKSLVHGMVLAKLKPVNKLRSTNTMMHNRALEHF